MKGCPNCRCTTFRRVGTTDPETQERLAKEYEIYRDNLWG